MKTLIALFIFCLTVLAVDVTLIWNANDPLDQVEGYRLYQSTNIAGPFNYIGSANTTNFVVTGLSPGVYFWYVTATNYWGESLPSNKASTPPVAGKVMQLKVNRP